MKPDIDAYLKHRTVRRSAFLRYKDLLDDGGDNFRAWYEPTLARKRKEFIEKTDWGEVTSNVERLPMLAYYLENALRPLFRTGTGTRCRDTSRDKGTTLAPDGAGRTSGVPA